MAIIRLAAADSDREYLDRLISVLKEHEDLEISVYSDRDSFNRGRTSESPDIVLFTPSMYDSTVPFRRGVLPVVLADGEEPLPDALMNVAVIEKYQRISSIYRSITGLYEESLKTGGAPYSGKTMVSAFYSPAGGVGKTTLALAAAHKLARNGYTALYINLEDVPSDGCYLPQVPGADMSEAVTSFGQGQDPAGALRSLVHVKDNNFYYINHFNNIQGPERPGADGLAGLIRGLAGTGLFDAVIVDMGSSVDERTFSIFGSADRIVIVEKPDTMSETKLAAFLSQDQLVDKYAEKMIRVINFCNLSEYSLGVQIPISARIGSIQNPDSAQIIEMLVNYNPMEFTESLI